VAQCFFWLVSGLFENSSVDAYATAVLILSMLSISGSYRINCCNLVAYNGFVMFGVSTAALLWALPPDTLCT
jgi:hypothetical protein